MAPKAGKFQRCPVISSFSSVMFLGLILVQSFIPYISIGDMSIECYRLQLSGVFASGDFPCGNLNTTTAAVPCCYNGDFCLDDGLCYHSTPATGMTGYYVGSCTDPSGYGPGCSNKCTNEGAPDIVYNNASNLWQCCGNINSTIDCSHPQNDFFTAPAVTAL